MTSLLTIMSSSPQKGTMHQPNKKGIKTIQKFVNQSNRACHPLRSADQGCLDRYALIVSRESGFPLASRWPFVNLGRSFPIHKEPLLYILMY